MESPSKALLTKAAIEARVDALPVLPSSVPQLLALDDASNRFFDDLCRVVERDPAYAVRLLAFANSAAFHAKTPANRVSEAVLRLGASRTRTLLLSIGVTRAFPPVESWECDLWAHSLMVASIARCLASRTDLATARPDEAYLCGLLHDIGRFVMAVERPEVAYLENGIGSDKELLAAEISACGIDHTQVGARTVTRWGLGADLALVVRGHHTVSNGRDLNGRHADLVRTAEGVVRAHDLQVGSQDDAASEEVDARLQGLLPTLLPPWYRPKADTVVTPVRVAIREAIVEGATLMSRG